MRAFLVGIGTVLAAASRRWFEDTGRATKRMRLATGVAVACLLSLDAAAAGPRTWYEIKSPHFVLWSDANNGDAKDVAWQFEQVRSVVTALWPWAKVDLPRPIRVLAVKDESGMKALAPEYWERKGAVHPASVWVEAADRDYMLVRTDLDAPNQRLVNPYTNTYFSYAYLILTSSVPHRLPLWMSRGLAGVVSNTVIRDKKVLMGPPIPWHLQALRDRPHLRLTELVAVTEQTPDYRQSDFLSMFDAESWAFVHFLMFGSNGAHRAQVNAFVKQVADGAPAAQAFAETIGKPEDLESPFSAYINRNLFSFLQPGIRRLEPNRFRDERHDRCGRLTEARILWTLKSPDAARQAASVALSLADSDAARRAAQQLLASLK
jgi:hypothetical protein